jgi:hypothetical protein
MCALLCLKKTLCRCLYAERQPRKHFQALERVGSLWVQAKLQPDWLDQPGGCVAARKTAATACSMRPESGSVCAPWSHPPLLTGLSWTWNWVNRQVYVGVVLPSGVHDQNCGSLHVGRPLWREDGYVSRTIASGNCQSSHCRTHGHTLPSHLRMCSLSVASYDSQGLRWRYSNPPPHGSLNTKFLLIHI